VRGRHLASIRLRRPQSKSPGVSTHLRAVGTLRRWAERVCALKLKRAVRLPEWCCEREPSGGLPSKISAGLPSRREGRRWTERSPSAFRVALPFSREASASNPLEIHPGSRRCADRLRQLGHRLTLLERTLQVTIGRVTDCGSRLQLSRIARRTATAETHPVVFLTRNRRS